eukprot:4405018-Amphidinium_carterae.1
MHWSRSAHGTDGCARSLKRTHTHTNAKRALRSQRIRQVHLLAPIRCPLFAILFCLCRFQLCTEHLCREECKHEVRMLQTLDCSQRSIGKRA